MVLSPSVVPPSTDALVKHILTVGNSVNVASVIQYSPTVGGGKLTPEAIKQICDKSKNKLYIKAEPIPPAPFVDSIRTATNGKIGIFAGNMCLQMIDLLDRGVTGFMPGVSLVPIFDEIFHTYARGDRARAKQIYDAAMPMVLILNQDIEVLCLYEKMMMVKRGIISNSYCRKPTAFPYDERFWNMFNEYRENLRAIVNVGEDYQASSS